MNSHVKHFVKNRIGFIELDRPQALNSLSLDMIRAMTFTLLAWRSDPGINAVVIRGNGGKAFCAGGDIRFFHQAGHATPGEGSALLEDFFTEEYSLNHLIHHYPKPYIALMDGIVMGGGMGIAQAGPASRMRIVTERTRMAMPEVHIGLFPDVGGSFFLSRTPGAIGAFLGVTGETIAAADALYAGLADLFVPTTQLPALLTLLEAGIESSAAVRAFAAPYRAEAEPAESLLARHRALIDRHFSADSVPAIVAGLEGDPDSFAQKILDLMKQRSPLMMAVTLALLRRGAALDYSQCLRMERSLVRRCFEHGEILEGVRARVVDKDNAPRWNPASLAQVTPEMVDSLFVAPWPEHAHPLRHLT